MSKRKKLTSNQAICSVAANQHPLSIQLRELEGFVSLFWDDIGKGMYNTAHIDLKRIRQQLDIIESRLVGL